MKTEELKNIIKESISREIKKAILEGISEEVYIIKNKQGEPIEQFETEEDAQKALETYKKDNPDQELIIEPGKKLSFEELDKMSEKLESMKNMNESTHKGHFTMEQVLKLAKKAGDVVPDAQDALEELCEMYGEKVPASRVFEILDDYDMPELKSKIKVKKAEPKEDMSMDEKLYGDQDKLDVDGDGEIEASDLAKLRAGEESEDEVEEGEDCMECGGSSMEEGETCEKCGQEICECGTMKNEGKLSIRLSESELVTLIKKMVSEAVPGMETYEKSHKGSGSQNDEALSDVEKKIKEYLNFDGNDNPEFPNQIGGEVKARRADEKESEEVADHRGGGLEDLIYDVDPSKEAQDRHEMALKGDTKMGNSQDAANVVPSKLGEKIIKKVKRKDKEEEKMPMYNKDVQPSREVKESEQAAENVISEEIQRMKQMASYNKKTQ
jgi:hypothetical protein